MTVHVPAWAVAYVLGVLTPILAAAVYGIRQSRRKEGSP